MSEDEMTGIIITPFWGKIGKNITLFLMQI